MTVMRVYDDNGGVRVVSGGNGVSAAVFGGGDVDDDNGNSGG